MKLDLIRLTVSSLVLIALITLEPNKATGLFADEIFGFVIYKLYYAVEVFAACYSIYSIYSLIVNTFKEKNSVLYNYDTLNIDVRYNPIHSKKLYNDVNIIKKQIEDIFPFETSIEISLVDKNSKHNNDG
jgi:hypothetical protein